MMHSVTRRIVITGAFSYIGAAAAKELLHRGNVIHALTNRRPPADSCAITSAPLKFDTEHLMRELASTDTLVNTYWIRLPHGGQTFSSAVANSRILIEAAARAGVRRVVHVSVSNAAAGANLGYYAGKAEVEDIVRHSGMEYSIVRPTLVIGPADVLTSNIAWFLRRFPIFPMPAGGSYRLQPVTLADTGRIIADALTTAGNLEMDAAGPEIYTFREFVSLLAHICGLRRWIVSAPRWLALTAVRGVGLGLRDVVLTREELLGLQQELLLSHGPPRGMESVSAWLKSHGDQLGKQYVNDLHRHFGNGRKDVILPHDTATLAAHIPT